MASFVNLVQRLTKEATLLIYDILLISVKSIIYQYSDINLRATLSESGRPMWPPGEILYKF